MKKQLICWAVALTSGCQSTNQRAESGQVASLTTVDKIPDFVCRAEETPQWLALGEVNWTKWQKITEANGATRLIDISRNEYVPLFEIDPMNWDPTAIAASHFEHNLRMDFCATALGDVRLIRILVGAKNKKLQIIDPYVSGAVVAGFSEAVFGDTAKLTMDIPLADGLHFRLREFVPVLTADAQQIPSLFYGIGRLEASSKVTPRNGTVVVGKIQFDADPFGPCARYRTNGAYLEQSTKFGAAQLDTKICVTSVGGDTFAYTIVGLKLTHPQLSEKSGGSISDNQMILDGVDATKKRLRLQLTHHSTCDQFSLDIQGFGVLAATAAPWGRSDHVDTCNYLPEAPRIPQDGHLARWILKFRDGHEEKGELSQRYFIDEERLGELQQ